MGPSHPIPLFDPLCQGRGCPRRGHHRLRTQILPFPAARPEGTRVACRKVVFLRGEPGVGQTYLKNKDASEKRPALPGSPRCATGRCPRPAACSPVAGVSVPQGCPRINAASAGQGSPPGGGAGGAALAEPPWAAGSSQPRCDGAYFNHVPNQLTARSKARGCTATRPLQSAPSATSGARDTEEPRANKQGGPGHAASPPLRGRPETL